MPTIKELHERANYLIDDQMDFMTAIEHFNECLEDVSQYAKNEKTIMGTVGTDGKIPVPDDFIKMVRLRVSGDEITWAYLDEDTDYRSYTMFGGEIQLLSKPGSEQPYEMLYYSELPAIKTVNEDGTPVTDFGFEPPLPNRFQRLLSLYAAVRYFDNWEGNPDQRANYKNQYEALKSDFIYEGMRKENRNRRKQVVIRRDWR